MAVPPASARGYQNPRTDATETKRHVRPALHGVMEPGEQILAGACAVTGWRWRQTCIGLGLSAWAIVIFPIVSSLSPLGSLLLGLAPILLVPLYILDTTRRRVFVAVTDRQLICVSMKRLFAGRVRFHAPIGTFHIRRAVRRSRYHSLTYAGPGAPAAGLRVTATGEWRQDMDEVATALQAAGVPVGGFVPAVLAH